MCVDVLCLLVGKGPWSRDVIGRLRKGHLCEAVDENKGKLPPAYIYFAIRPQPECFERLLTIIPIALAFFINCQANSSVKFFLQTLSRASKAGRPDMDGMQSAPCSMQASECFQPTENPSPPDREVVGASEHDRANEDKFRQVTTDEDAYQGSTEPQSHLGSSSDTNSQQPVQSYDAHQPENDIVRQGGLSKKSLAVNTNIRGPQLPSIELTPQEASSVEKPLDTIQNGSAPLFSPSYSSTSHVQSPSRLRIELAARPESRPGSAFAPHDPRIDFPFANARRPMSPWWRAGHARSRSDNYVGHPLVRHTAYSSKGGNEELMAEDKKFKRDHDVHVDHDDVSEQQVKEDERRAHLLKKQRLAKEHELVDAELGKQGFLYPNSADAKIMQLVVESYLLSAQMARILEYPIKMQSHSMTAYKVAQGLKYPPLEALCQYWIGLALYSQEAWIAAMEAFKMSRGAEGRYVRPEEVEKAMNAAKAANENEDIERLAVPLKDLTLCLREDNEDILQERKHHRAEVAESFEMIPTDVIAQVSPLLMNESSGPDDPVFAHMSNDAGKIQQQEGKDQVENTACDDEASSLHFVHMKQETSEEIPLSEEMLRSCTPRSLQEELSDITSDSDDAGSDNRSGKPDLFEDENVRHDVQADEGPAIQHPQPRRPIATAHIEAASRRQSPRSETSGQETHAESQSPPSPLNPSSLAAWEKDGSKERYNSVGESTEESLTDAPGVINETSFAGSS